MDELQEKIAEFEDYVQSSDIAAMQSKPPYLLSEFVPDDIAQNCKPRSVICSARVEMCPLYNLMCDNLGRNVHKTV